MVENKLSLFENSMSFFSESLNKAITASEDALQWKFAIVSLVQSIELALKERLRVEHSFLVFRNVDNRRETVSMDLAIQRLEAIRKDIFTVNDKKSIDSAKQLRNSIIHYDFNFDTNQAESLFNTLVGFYSEFLRKNLNLQLSDLVDSELWEKFISLKKHILSLEKRAIERINNEDIPPENVFYCHRCSSSLFVVEHRLSMSGACYLCGNKNHLEHCHICGGLYQLDMLDWFTHIPTPDGDVEFNGHICRSYCQSKVALPHQ